MSRMRRRMVHAYERAAQPSRDHWLQRQFPHLKVERGAVLAAVAWALVTAAPTLWVGGDHAPPLPLTAAQAIKAHDLRRAWQPGTVFAEPFALEAAGIRTTPAPDDAHDAVNIPPPPPSTVSPPLDPPVPARWLDNRHTVKSRRFLGQALLFALLAEAFLLALARSRLPDGRRLRAEWGVALVATATAWGGYALGHFGLDAEWLPLALPVGLVALGMANLPTAVWTATLVAVVAVVAVDAGMAQSASMFAATWMMATLVRGVRRRALLVLIAFGSGLAGVLVEAVWVLGAAGDPLWALGVSARGWDPVAVFVVGGGLAGGLLCALIRPMETWFGVTTRMRLQALLDLEHPLVRRLVNEAPGTYNHSVLVGALAEAGAEAADADGLLAKAGGYFHDIGKLFKPGYFTENEQGVSRHDRLSPYLSALIIIAHVKDGGELAEAYGLPPAVVHIVRSHHGDSKTAYFLHRARQRARPGETVSDSSFMYPGPLPHTPEAAAVMLADAIEAAARSLGTAGTERLRKLVHEIFMGRLLDGQLADAGLDLAQLTRMEQAMYRMLVGMYHGRVKYPGQDEPRRRR